MFISIFSDEFYKDIYKVLPIIKSWGMEYVDFRALINGKPIENQTDEELHTLKKTLDEYGIKTGVLQTSLCKVHLPDKSAIDDELVKLDGIIRAAEILDCNLVRGFNFWQHPQDHPECGELAMRPDMLSRVLEMYYPVYKKAKAAGLIMGLENCGQTPNEVISVLEGLGDPDWGMAWDVSNMFELLPEAKGDCVDYFTKALKYANMIHVKARGVETIPELDFKKVPWSRVLAGAATTGKNIPVSIETHVPPTSQLDKEEACKRCYDYVKKVWPAAAPADMKTALTPVDNFERDYSDNPVNMVVVGLGMGKNRCTQISETNGVNLYGVCDLKLDLAKEIGEQFDTKYSDNIDDFLNDENVEAMYIVTYTGTHCELAKKCLDAGKHVLLTKPMDANAEICKETIEYAKSKNLILGVDFDLHFRGPLTELKMAADNNFFGDKIKCANIILNVRRDQKYYDENGKWRGTWALDGGGALSNQGIHEVDRLLTILGIPEKVRTYTAKQTFDIEAEDLGISEWVYENGCVARISATTSYLASSWYTRVEFYGDEGAYLLVAGGPEGNHTYWYKNDQWSEEAPYHYEREWRQGSDNFAYCIRKGGELVVPAEKGYVARYVLDRMYESANNDGKWIKIDKDLM